MWRASGRQTQTGKDVDHVIELQLGGEPTMCGT